MKWFISQSEKVQGPWNTDQVMDWLNSQQDRNGILIFRRGLTEWLTVTDFLRGDTSEFEERTLVTKEETLWHYAIEGVSHGPITRPELIQQLSRMKNNSSAVLWTRGMKAWVPVYEFSDIMDEVGINRRQYPRLAISGTVKIQFEQKAYEGTAQTISETGFGAQMAMPMEAGQIITFEIHSPQVSSAMRGRAEVRYVTGDLTTGFKFHLLDATTRTTLHDLIKQTGRSTGKAAA